MCCHSLGPLSLSPISRLTWGPCGTGDSGGRGSWSLLWSQRERQRAGYSLHGHLCFRGSRESGLESPALCLQMYYHLETVHAPPIPTPTTPFPRPGEGSRGGSGAGRGFLLTQPPSRIGVSLPHPQSGEAELKAQTSHSHCPHRRATKAEGEGTFPGLSSKSGLYPCQPMLGG